MFTRVISTAHLFIRGTVYLENSCTTVIPESQYDVEPPRDGLKNYDFVVAEKIVQFRSDFFFFFLVVPELLTASVGAGNSLYF